MLLESIIVMKVTGKSNILHFMFWVDLLSESFYQLYKILDTHL